MPNTAPYLAELANGLDLPDDLFEVGLGLNHWSAHSAGSVPLDLTPIWADTILRSLYNRIDGTDSRRAALVTTLHVRLDEPVEDSPVFAWSMSDEQVISAARRSPRVGHVVMELDETVRDLRSLIEYALPIEQLFERDRWQRWYRRDRITSIPLIHSVVQCRNIINDPRRDIVPELSGRGMGEVLGALGGVLCRYCVPGAPRPVHPVYRGESMCMEDLAGDPWCMSGRWYQRCGCGTVVMVRVDGLAYRHSRVVA